MIRLGRPATPEEIAQSERDRRRFEHEQKHGPGTYLDFVSPHELWGDVEAKAKEARQALAADIAAAMVQAQGKGEPAQSIQAEPATIPQDEADRPPQRGYTQPRAVELAAVLDAIEARAHECGVPLVRSQWPGTKAEFRGFLKWYAPRLLWALPTDNDNLTDELRPHGVAFGKPGRARDKGKKIYQELFPDYPA